MRARRRLLTALAAVALGVGGVVLPGQAPASAGAVPAPVACPAAQLPLGPGADDPDAPRPALPVVADAVAGDALAAPGLLVADGVPAPPAVPATAWLVADLDTGEVLAACNAHVPFAPASTLKVLTALALLPGLDPAAVHTAGRPEAQVGGSRVGLVQGSQYTVDDLAHGLMLASGNDAAVALGEIAGGPEAATARMRAVAQGLGALSTVPRTLNGLDAPGQVSTPHDLAVIARAALAEPRVAGPASTPVYDFPASGDVGQAGRDFFQIQTSSRLLRSYDGATGLKSGFTKAAGGSYVGTAERDGRRYVATVMRAQGGAWRHSADLLDWAFANGAAAEPVGRLADASDAPPPASTAPASPAPGAEAGGPGAAAPSPGPPEPGATAGGPTAPATAGDGEGDGAAAGGGEGPGATAAGTQAPADPFAALGGDGGQDTGAQQEPVAAPAVQAAVVGAVLLACLVAAVAGVSLHRRKTAPRPDRPV